MNGVPATGKPSRAETETMLSLFILRQDVGQSLYGTHSDGAL